MIGTVNESHHKIRTTIAVLMILHGIKKIVKIFTDNRKKIKNRKKGNKRKKRKKRKKILYEKIDDENIPHTSCDILMNYGVNKIKL